MCFVRRVVGCRRAASWPAARVASISTCGVALQRASAAARGFSAVALGPVGAARSTARSLSALHGATPMLWWSGGLGTTRSFGAFKPGSANLSLERTASGALRAPTAAAQLQRYAA
jgi:hypothetical protein